MRVVDIVATRDREKYQRAIDRRYSGVIHQLTEADVRMIFRRIGEEIGRQTGSPIQTNT